MPSARVALSRDRLVAEASEHVLGFDWADVARQVTDVYTEVVGTWSRAS